MTEFTCTIGKHMTHFDARDAKEAADRAAHEWWAWLNPDHKRIPLNVRVQGLGEDRIIEVAP